MRKSRSNYKNIATRWLTATAAVLITAYILPGVSVSGFLAALMAAVVIGLINTFIRPLLIFFTLPLTVMSLGIFLLVINAFLILLAGAVVPGFAIANFWWALLFSLILSVVNSFLKSNLRSSAEKPNIRNMKEDTIIVQEEE